MCDIFLFKRAFADYNAALLIAKGSMDDELLLNTVCYNLQQSVEKVLKGYLELHGVTVGHTHEISKLVRMSTDNGSPCVLTDWVRNNAYMLDAWEAKTRYIKDFFAGRTEAKNGLVNVKEFLIANGVSLQPLSVITEEVRSRMVAGIPLSDLPKSALEWNVLYIAFRYQLNFEIKNKEYVEFDLSEYFKIMGVTDYAAEIDRLKKVYGTNDINEIKSKLKEAMSKLI